MSEFATRNREIYQLRESGLAFKLIGAKFGISGARAQQVHQRENLSRRMMLPLSTKRKEYRLYISVLGGSARFEYFDTEAEAITAQGIEHRRLSRTHRKGLVRVERWYAPHSCYRGLRFVRWRYE